jgi:hypothetical protein
VPSALGIIVGLPPTNAAAAELLVPTSIPIVFLTILTPQPRTYYYLLKLAYRISGISLNIQSSRSCIIFDYWN